MQGAPVDEGMKMGLIDRAAQALALAQDGVDWDHLAPETQARFRENVRLVLNALREPDEAMAEAGAEIIRNVGPSESDTAHASDAVNTWRFMIDALRDERL